MRHCGLAQKWTVDFSVGKTPLVSLNQSNNFGAIHVKMYEFQ